MRATSRISTCFRHVPVHILTILCFILFEDERRKWIYQCLRAVVLTCHGFAFTLKILYTVSYARSSLDGSPTGSLLFYTTIMTTWYKYVLLYLFIWKSCYKRKMQKFLRKVQNGASCVQMKSVHSIAILTWTLLGFCLYALFVFFWSKYIAEEPIYQSRFSWMENSSLEKVMIRISYIQDIYTFALSYLFAPFIAWACLHIASFLKQLEEALSGQIKNRAIYQTGSFTNFVAQFKHAKIISAQFKDLVDIGTGWFLVVCINDFVINVYIFGYMVRCGFPIGPLTTGIVLSVINFFLFVIPCTHLHCQVSTSVSVATIDLF